jgi:hypothetical protein
MTCFILIVDFQIYLEMKVGAAVCIRGNRFIKNYILMLKDAKFLVLKPVFGQSLQIKIILNKKFGQEQHH